MTCAWDLSLLDLKRAEAGEWRAVDADMGYTILTRPQLPAGGAADVLWQASEMATGRCTN